MDITTFKNVAGKLPSHIAVLMRGPTGIGKSHIVHQVGERLGISFARVKQIESRALKRLKNNPLAASLFF